MSNFSLFLEIFLILTVASGGVKAVKTEERGNIRNHNLRRVDPGVAKPIASITQHRNNNAYKRQLQTQNDVIPPTYVDCGVSQINIPGIFNQEFQCTADGQPVIYESSLEPAENLGVNIDPKSGVLNFLNYHSDVDVVLTVRAINGAGSISTSILLKKVNNEEKDGVWVKFRALDIKECDDDSSDVTVQGTYTKIIPNLSGLDADDTYYYTWYQLLDITHLSQIHSFIAEFEGHIDVKTVGTYQFISTISEGMIIRVYIDDLEIPVQYTEECAYNTEKIQFDKELSEGEHIIYIQLYSYKSYYLKSCSWIFNFQYKKPGEETPSVIPFKTHDSSSQPVYGLSMEKNEFVLLQDAVSTINFRVLGTDTYTCKLNDGEVLPTGLQLTKNSITGNPQEEQESIKTYHLTCSNDYSTTNTITFTIRVTKKSFNGIVGYYLKTKSFDRKCLTPYDTSMSETTTEVVKIEQNPNHELSEKQILWIGLGKDFYQDFAVYWEGYIRIAKPTDAGDYEFQLTSSDASWLYIDNQLIVDNSGCHNFTSKQGQFTLNDDSYSLKIMYVQQNGPSGIKLEYKKKGTDKFEIVPNSMFLYVPNNAIFEYETPIATYTVGEIIEPNIVKKYNSEITFKSFVSDIDLPKGLSISDDGTITGIPEKDAKGIHKQKYNIIATADDDKKYTSTIYITIQGTLKVSGIYFINVKTGEKTTELRMTLGLKYQFLVSTENGMPISFSFDSLPAGFSFDNSIFTLTAFPRSLANGLTLKITAKGVTDDDIISESPLYYVTNSCGEGEVMMYHITTSEWTKHFSSITIKFFDAKGTTEKKEYGTFVGGYGQKNDLPYEKSFCFVPGKYVLQIAVLSGNWNNYETAFTDFYLNGMKMIHFISINQNTLKYLLNFIISEPKISYYPASQKLYIDQDVYIAPKADVLIEKASIDKKLPEGLIFNTTNGRIYGRTTAASHLTEYTITSSNSAGEYKTTLQLEVTSTNITASCIDDNKILYQMKITTATVGSCVVYSLKNSKEEELYRIDQFSFDGNEKHEISMCLSQDTYQSNVISGDLVSAGYCLNIETFLNGMKLDTIRSGKKTEYNFDFLYYQTEKWEYSTVYSEGWNSKTATKGWDEYRLSELPDFTTTTVYLRLIKDFPDLSKDVGLKLYLGHKSGIILYINGEKIYSRNMPEYYFILTIFNRGDVKNDTPAEKAFDSLKDIILLIPSELLKTNPSNIAIELHRLNDEEIKPEVYSMAITLPKDESDDCLHLNKYTTVSDKSGEAFPNRVDKAFDEDVNTLWQSQCPEADKDTHIPYVTISFAENTFGSFNQLNLIGDNVASPKEVTVSYSMEGKMIDLVHKTNDDFINITYGSAKYPTIRSNFYDDKVVVASKIKTSIPDYDKSVVEWNMVKMGIREIQYMICPVKKCAAIANVVEESYSNSVITKECSGGRRVLYCSNGIKPMWEELSNNCNEKPVISYQESEYSFVTGDAVKDLKLFNIFGSITEYVMNPKINGIVIDENGKLQGRPLEVSPKQEYTFTAKSESGNVEVKIQIEVLQSNKPYPLFINETISLYVGEEFKDVIFSKIVGENIVFSEVDTLPDGIYLNSETGTLFGQYFKEEIVEVNVNASNSNGFVLYSVKVIFTVSDFPIVASYSPSVELYYYETYGLKEIIKCYGENVKYELTGKLPEGISFEAGMLNGKTIVKEMEETTYTVKCFTKNNGTEKAETREIKISVTISDYPIIISNPGSMTIVAGDKMDNKEILNVTGKNLTFIITPNLPSKLIMDRKTGLLSGYAKESMSEREFHITITGTRTANADVKIIVVMPDNPVIIPTVESDDGSGDDDDGVVTITYTSAGLINIVLFDAIGENLEYSVDPPLPSGLHLNPQTGLITGMLNSVQNVQEYTFSVSDGVKHTSIKMKVGFKPLSCPAYDGYPETEVGKMGLKKCEGMSSGYKSRECKLMDNNEAKWFPEIDECSKNSGAIAAIVLGCVVGGSIIIGVVIVMLLRCRSKKASK